MMLSIGELVLLLGMATAAGLVGCFAVMRRMTLASDAISHVALPGIGLALLVNVQPLFGAVGMLLLGTLLIWLIESRTRIATETVIGVVFSAALAVGALFTPDESLMEALLGAPGTLTDPEIWFGIAASIGVIAVVLGQRDRLVIALVSRDLARTSGIDVSRLSLVYLITFAVTVALGLRYLGVLLMGSLIIIPAATAKHLATTVRSMLVIAVAVAIAATLAGTVVARAHDADTGPVIIAMAALVFFGALLARSRAGVWRRRSAKAGS
jgi:ABC-type Mn2+/Zn2+ transport system permease subunit